jgi:hypothetical protein
VNRKILQWLTLALLAVSMWTVYANVLSDDAEVRVKARTAVNTAAGCGDACRLENLRGERGMLEERIEYDLVKQGHYVVVCRRAFIVAGDYRCEVTEGNVAEPRKAASSASTSGPATPAASSTPAAKK